MGEIIMENILLYNKDIPIQLDTEKVNGTIQWTNEQIKYIIDQYLYGKMPITAIAKQFGRSDTSIKKILNQNNIKTRSGRLYRNSNYFENIDSRDKAYWLGLMYSDGCVCKRTNDSYSVSLEMIDKEHIEKFRDALNAINHKISTVHHKHFDNAKLSYAIYIYDKKMAKDLIKLGCVPRKSVCLSSIPNVPQEFIYDFIRGFVDGDGCICYNASRDLYVFKLTGASPLFLKDVMKVLEIDRL
jgi:intein-encoded DNA endonuclease-like protein